jgi:putative tryptophan/tyrosine transport system substrate-binding protein
VAPDRPRLSRHRFLQGSLTLAGVGLLAGCGILPPQAPQPAKVHRIGLLSPDSREGAASTVAAILEALAEFGYVEGRNLAVEERFGVSEAELPTVAAELVRAGVDVLVPFGTPGPPRRPRPRSRL